MAFRNLTSLKPFLRILWVPPALFFIAAALPKAANPLAFLIDLADYSIPASLDGEALLVLLLPSLEILLGMLLLFGGVRWVPIAALTTLILFTAAIALGLPHGYLRHCGCLGPENWSPAWALIKNAILILCLILGSRGSPQFAVRRNPWGAFAVVAAGSSTGAPILLPFFALGAILTAFAGVRHFSLYLLGLVAGLTFYALHIPILIVVLVGTAYSLWRVKSPANAVQSSLTMSFGLFFVVILQIAMPPPPKIPGPLLNAGEPWPASLIQSAELPANENGESMVVLLSPECDLCRLWIPTIKAMSRRRDLPPLVGLAPESRQELDSFLRRENLPFLLLPCDAQDFSRAAERTPRLIFVKRDTIRYVFPEGRLPSQAPLQAIISNAQE